MTNAPLIRLAVASEGDALEALQWRASLSNPGDREALLAHPDAIALPLEQIVAGHVFLAEIEGKVLGFATVLARGDGDVEIDGLFVEPEYWRRGIGRVLIGRCERFALARGASALCVVGNPHTAAFYAACGFKGAGTEATRFGPGLLFRKGLPGAATAQSGPRSP